MTSTTSFYQVPICGQVGRAGHVGCRERRDESTMGNVDAEQVLYYEFVYISK